MKLLGVHVKYIKFVVPIIIFLAASSSFLLVVSGFSTAQDQNSNMRSLIQRLVNNDVQIYVHFIEPVSEGKIIWPIPEEISYDGESVVGRRIFKEVGDDYLCVDEVGQGATFVDCVPFSNIAFVNYIGP